MSLKKFLSTEIIAVSMPALSLHLYCFVKATLIDFEREIRINFFLGIDIALFNKKRKHFCSHFPHPLIRRKEF